MATVGQAVAAASKPKSATVAWNPAWARFAGLYRGRWGDKQVVLLNERLVIITPNAPTLDNPASLDPVGEGRFRYGAPTGGREIGEIVRFVEEPGRPMRMVIGDTWIDKVAAQ